MNTKATKISLVITTTFLLSITSLSAWSETKDKYDIAYDSCVNKAGAISNGVIEQCSGVASEMVTKDLQSLYDKILKTMSEQSFEDAKKFENSQKAWLKYKETHCELMGSYVGSPEYSLCPLALDKLRAIELQQLADQ